jgi:hypothetical protein
MQLAQPRHNKHNHVQQTTYTLAGSSEGVTVAQLDHPLRPSLLGLPCLLLWGGPCD